MKPILFSLVFAVTVFGAAAQWSGNPAVGTPVATTSPTTSKTGNVAVSDGAGGMFTAWIDNRTATPTIYVQRILPDGSLRFATEVVVSNAAGATSSGKTNLYAVADGVGGVILVWQDSRNRSVAFPNNDDIYGQRVDANGNVLWTANGVRLTVADNSVSNKINPVVDVVNATDAIVVFGDSRNGSSDLFAQKILIATGATQWVAEVNLHGAQPNTQTGQVVLRDGVGGLLVVWQDPRVSTTTTDIYGQRIDNTGALLWGTSGTVISAAAFQQIQPQIVSDNAGGLVAVWSDQRVSNTDAGIYAQRVSSAGTAQWTADGVPVDVSAFNQTNPYIVNSGSNYIIAWSDNRTVATGDRNIYAQSLDNTGAQLWAAGGVPIVTATGNQPNNVNSGLAMINDGLNNAVLIWEDARAGSSALDLYAQKISPSGMVQWTANGVPVSTATANQQGPVAVASTGGRVIVSWRDSRTSTNGEIFAARLQSTGVLPVRSLTLNAIARNASVDLQWNTLDESNTASFIVEKSSDGVNFSAIGSAKAKGSGNGAYALADNRPVKGTNYYRVKSVDVDRRFAYSSVVTVAFSGSTKAGIAVYPNPVANAAVLQLSNLAAGNYRLTVRDLSGKAVLAQTVPVVSGYQQTQLSLQSLAAGTYFVQLQKGSEKAFSQMIQKQ